MLDDRIGNDSNLAAAPRTAWIDRLILRLLRRPAVRAAVLEIAQGAASSAVAAVMSTRPTGAIKKMFDR